MGKKERNTSTAVVDSVQSTTAVASLWSCGAKDAQIGSAAKNGTALRTVCYCTAYPEQAKANRNLNLLPGAHGPYGPGTLMV